MFEITITFISINKHNKDHGVTIYVSPKPPPLIASQSKLRLKVHMSFFHFYEPKLSAHICFKP